MAGFAIHVYFKLACGLQSGVPIRQNGWLQFIDFQQRLQIGPSPPRAVESNRLSLIVERRGAENLLGVDVLLSQ